MEDNLKYEEKHNLIKSQYDKLIKKYQKDQEEIKSLRKTINETNINVNNNELLFDLNSSNPINDQLKKD